MPWCLPPKPPRLCPPPNPPLNPPCPPPNPPCPPPNPRPPWCPPPCPPNRVHHRIHRVHHRIHVHHGVHHRVLRTSWPPSCLYVYRRNCVLRHHVFLRGDWPPSCLYVLRILFRVPLRIHHRIVSRDSRHVPRIHHQSHHRDSLHPGCCDCPCHPSPRCLSCPSCCCCPCCCLCWTCCCRICCCRSPWSCLCYPVVKKANKFGLKIQKQPNTCSHLNLFLFRRLIFIKFLWFSHADPFHFDPGETRATLLFCDAQTCNI